MNCSLPGSCRKRKARNRKMHYGNYYLPEALPRLFFVRSGKSIVTFQKVPSDPDGGFFTIPPWMLARVATEPIATAFPSYHEEQYAPWPLMALYASL